MKTYMMAAALAVLVAAPAFAQTGGPRTGAQPFQAFGAVTPFGVPGQMHMDAARQAAIRECNAAAAKWYPTRDSNISFQQYRMCMAQHGQPE